MRTHRDVSLITPEAVVIEMDTAGLGSRMLALAIDAAVVLSASLLLVAALAGANRLGAGSTAVGAIVIFSIFSLRILYPALCESRWRGRTLGKAALGLRVVTVDGAPARFRHAVVRSIVGFFEIDATGGALALIAVLLSKRNQRLGDRAAGTMVIRERSAARTTEAVRFEPWPGTEGFVATLDVSRIGSPEYAAVRAFLLRAPSLAPEVRDRLARQIATPLTTRVSQATPPNMSAEAFLASVAAAVQRRSQSAAAGTDYRPPGGVETQDWGHTIRPATAESAPTAPTLSAPPEPADGGFTAPT